MKTILSYSGGLDSTVLLYHLIAQGDEVYCLYFSYGSKHSERELQAARAICNLLKVTLQVVSLDFINDLFQSSLLKNSSEKLPEGKPSDASMQSTVVPGRNSIFASIMMGYAESIDANRIALATHADDHAIYPDTRPEWVAALRLLAFHGTVKQIGVYTPFSEITKKEICQLGLKLGVPFEKTWSCYKGAQVPCGVCGACDGREKALQSLRLG